MEAVKTMIHDQDLPMHLWAEATRTTVYVQNKVSHSALEFKTPKEVFSRKKPEVSHLKIFGCPVFIHIPEDKRTKLDASGKQRLYVGYCEVSKAFRIYIPRFHRTKISRDVDYDDGVGLNEILHQSLDEEPVGHPSQEHATNPSDEVVFH